MQSLHATTKTILTQVKVHNSKKDCGFFISQKDISRGGGLGFNLVMPYGTLYSPYADVIAAQVAGGVDSIPIPADCANLNY